MRLYPLNLARGRSVDCKLVNGVRKSQVKERISLYVAPSRCPCKSIKRIMRTMGIALKKSNSPAIDHTALLPRAPLEE